MTVWKTAGAIVLAVCLLFFGSAIVAGLFDGVQQIRGSSEPTVSLHETIFALDPERRKPVMRASAFTDDQCREINTVLFLRMDASGTAFWNVHCANNNRTYRVAIKPDNTSTVTQCQGEACR